MRLFFGKRENLFDSKFIIDRYIDELDQFQLEQFFLAAEDLFEKIFIEHFSGWGATGQHSADRLQEAQVSNFSHLHLLWPMPILAIVP